jgi:hypothetical protein
MLHARQLESHRASIEEKGQITLIIGWTRAGTATLISFIPGWPSFSMLGMTNSFDNPNRRGCQVSEADLEKGRYPYN